MFDESNENEAGGADEAEGVVCCITDPFDHAVPKLFCCIAIDAGAPQKLHGIAFAMRSCLQYEQITTVR